MAYIRLDSFVPVPSTTTGYIYLDAAGKPCGKGWISASYNCSGDKRAYTKQHRQGDRDKAAQRIRDERRKAKGYREEVKSIDDFVKNVDVLQDEISARLANLEYDYDQPAPQPKSNRFKKLQDNIRQQQQKLNEELGMDETGLSARDRKAKGEKEAKFLDPNAEDISLEDLEMSERAGDQSMRGIGISEGQIKDVKFAAEKGADIELGKDRDDITGEDLIEFESTMSTAEWKEWKKYASTSMLDKYNAAKEARKTKEQAEKRRKAAERKAKAADKKIGQIEKKMAGTGRKKLSVNDELKLADEKFRTQSERQSALEGIIQATLAQQEAQQVGGKSSVVPFSGQQIRQRAELERQLRSELSKLSELGSEAKAANDIFEMNRKLSEENTGMKDVIDRSNKLIRESRIEKLKRMWDMDSPDNKLDSFIEFAAECKSRFDSLYPSRQIAIPAHASLLGYFDALSAMADGNLLAIGRYSVKRDRSIRRDSQGLGYDLVDGVYVLESSHQDKYIRI